MLNRPPEEADLVSGAGWTWRIKSASAPYPAPSQGMQTGVVNSMAGCGRPAVAAAAAAAAACRCGQGIAWGARVFKKLALEPAMGP